MVDKAVELQYLTASTTRF